MFNIHIWNQNKNAESEWGSGRRRGSTYNNKFQYQFSCKIIRMNAQKRKHTILISYIKSVHHWWIAHAISKPKIPIRFVSMWNTIGNSATSHKNAKKKVQFSMHGREKNTHIYWIKGMHRVFYVRAINLLVGAVDSFIAFIINILNAQSASTTDSNHQILYKLCYHKWAYSLLFSLSLFFFSPSLSSLNLS